MVKEYMNIELVVAIVAEFSPEGLIVRHSQKCRTNAEVELVQRHEYFRFLSSENRQACGH